LAYQVAVAGDGLGGAHGHHVAGDGDHSETLLEASLDQLRGRMDAGHDAGEQEALGAPVLGVPLPLLPVPVLVTGLHGQVEPVDIGTGLYGLGRPVGDDDRAIGRCAR